MKREIICNDCKDELRKLFTTDTPYQGEYVKFVNGKAKKIFICDQCGKGIPKDSECWAFTIYTKSYYPWEYEYLYGEAPIHGVNCEKVKHKGSGYLHGEDDDTIYDVDGVTYCGRCHVFY